MIINLPFSKVFRYCPLFTSRLSKQQDNFSYSSKQVDWNLLRTVINRDHFRLVKHSCPWDLILKDVHNDNKCAEPVVYIQKIFTFAYVGNFNSKRELILSWKENKISIPIDFKSLQGHLLQKLYRNHIWYM